MRAGWHTALDVQMDTHKWCSQYYGLYYNYGFINDVLKKDSIPIPEDDILNLVTHFTQTLYRADTIFVTSDMLHVLMQAAQDLPPEVVFDHHSLISPLGFCLFEEPLVGTDRSEKTFALHAIAWEVSKIAASEKHPDGSDAIMIWFMTNPLDFTDDYNEQLVKDAAIRSVPIPPLLLAHFYPTIVGEKMPTPTEPGSEIVCNVVRIFEAMQLLAQQTIGEPIKLRPQRQARKRADSYWTNGMKYISLITLRRKSVAKSDEDDEKKIEYSHRWMVRGHWRKQWYPSLKRHDWKYIYEYVKGPEDKPLMIRERRIFNFVR